MKKQITILAFLVLLSAGSVSANDSGFGLGIIAGEPTGPCFKAWLGPHTAFAGAVAWSVDQNSNLQLHGDYLLHDFSLIKIDKGRLPLYYGIGGRIRFREGPRDDNIGVRIPVGLLYLPANSSLDVFVEIVPILDLAPDTELGFNAAVGIRYFFGMARSANRK